ncbi:MFS transporter [Streptomyces sediminimaris]|uniref:MFS transporter n=1 Tax=Streptomyces sediminimaris TaxID=3383721 RepID=UPI003999ED7E
MTASDTAAEPAISPARPPGMVLALCCAAQFMVVVDVTIMNVALPDIRTGLHLGVTGQQWVINAYTLTFAGFLLLGARAADLIGHRRVMLAGLSMFTLFSVLGGLAPCGGWLIAARTVQGVGGALLAPSTLSVLTTAFTRPDARRKALGAWTGTAAAGAAAGMVAGGVLTDLLDWRWVLFVNGPIGASLLAAVPRYLDPTGPHTRSRRRLDVWGAVLATCGLSCLVYGIVTAAQLAWTAPTTLGALVLGVVLLAAFALVEARRGDTALIPLRVLRMRRLMLANGVAATIGVALFGMYFFMSLFLQDVNRYAPLRAGLAFMPAGLATMAGTLLGSRTVVRLGAGRQIMIGLAAAAAGTWWLSGNDGPVGYADHVLAPLVLTGLGLGSAFVPTTGTATSDVPASQAGLAAGLVTTSRQIGAALGLAVMTTAAGHAGPGAGEGVGAALRVASGVLAAGVVLGGILGRRGPDPASAA